MPDGTLAGARPGSGNFAITIRGRSAHAGRNPEDGRNALLAAADLALRLAAAKGPRLSINPSRIEGGSPTNVVPDLAILRVNMRPATPEDQERGQSLLEAAIAMVAQVHDVEVHCHGGFSRPPKPMTPEAEALFGLVAPGRRRPWPGDRLAADRAGCATAIISPPAGCPVVDTMGVRGGKIHSDEEYMIVGSLKPSARRCRR